jgi:probable blue pigment (indigoidine) exporter
VIVQQIAALAFASVLAITMSIAGRRGALEGVSGAAWLSALIAGALYYGVAFWFYLHGLRSCGPGVAGLFINLVPIFGIGTASVFLDDRFSSHQWADAALTISAISVVAALQHRPRASLRRLGPAS